MHMKNGDLASLHRKGRFVRVARTGDLLYEDLLAPELPSDPHLPRRR
jgi:hypothetical protein